MKALGKACKLSLSFASNYCLLKKKSKISLCVLVKATGNKVRSNLLTAYIMNLLLSVDLISGLTLTSWVVSKSLWRNIT